MTFVQAFFKKLEKHCGIAFRKQKLSQSINKCLIHKEKIISTDVCSTVKKLKFEIMHHRANLSSGVLATVAGMKSSGNTTRHNTPVRI
jgi:hypothetical protein